MSVKHGGGPLVSRKGGNLAVDARAAASSGGETADGCATQGECFSLLAPMG
jgi:hypothetical protein